MPRVLGLCLVVAVVLGLAPLARAAATERTGDAELFQPFDSGGFDSVEIRALQAAFAASGDYAGVLDGRWDDKGAAALDAWSAREFGGGSLNAHAAAAVTGLLDAVAADGWRETWLPDLGLAIALPLDRLAEPELEADGTRRWTTDGTFTVLTHRFDRAAASAWHAAAAAAGDAPQASRAPGRLVTTGTLRDGRVFHTRSDLVDGAWATVYLAADPAAEGALRLAAASLHAGRPVPLDVPAGGRLAGLVAAAARLVADAEPVPGPTALAPTPASFEAEIAAVPPTGANEASGTGTGFYIGRRLIVTAAHVVAGCTRARLPDGTPLDLVAEDARLDVAVLETPRPGRRWLALANTRLRLGQRVHAVGFPYYSIAGTSLNLTSGNVSALAGIDDDARFFSFTAPVQPGNSGGPLLDAKGAVLGLVVARLSEDYIVEATGSLPQNVNYALRQDRLADFLARNGLRSEESGITRFDVDDGMPDGVDAAIVPIVCG